LRLRTENLGRGYYEYYAIDEPHKDAEHQQGKKRNPFPMCALRFL